MHFHLSNLFLLSPQDIKIICAFGFSPLLGKLIRIHRINFLLALWLGSFSQMHNFFCKFFRKCIKNFIILLLFYTVFMQLSNKLKTIIIICNGQILCKLYNLVMRGRHLIQTIFLGDLKSLARRW